MTRDIAPADVYYYTKSTVIDKVILYYESGSYVLKIELSELKKILTSNHFLQISPKVAVNLRKIKSVIPAGPKSVKIILLNNVELKASGVYLKMLKQHFQF